MPRVTSLIPPEPAEADQVAALPSRDAAMTTSPKRDDELRPPQAPEIDRRLVLRPAHATGALLLLLIVTLALPGLFDHEAAELRRTVGYAASVLTCPTRPRVKNHAVLAA